MEVKFKDISGIILCFFNVGLDFIGWRGIWVKFLECKFFGISFIGLSIINYVFFILIGVNIIYIDIFEFKVKLGK